MTFYDAAGRRRIDVDESFYKGLKDVIVTPSGSAQNPDDQFLKVYEVGVIDETGMSAVPLPASAPLFGGALLALGGLGVALNRRSVTKGSAGIAA